MRCAAKPKRPLARQLAPLPDVTRSVECQQVTRAQIKALIAWRAADRNQHTAAGKCFLDMLRVFAEFEITFVATAGLRHRYSEGGLRLQGAPASIASEPSTKDEGGQYGADGNC
jgi:hypothetical protein